MNIEKTREYYSYLTNDDLCQCDYCKNYVKEIKAAYPEAARYLDNIGIDIEKPFETMPLEPDENENIKYICGQYVVIGSSEGFQPHSVGDIGIDIAIGHPSTNISDEHFVIEIFNILLKWNI